MAFTLLQANRNAMLTTLVAASPNGLNSGSLKIYAGSVPGNADAALGGATLLVSLPCSATFGTVATGTLTANAITQTNAATGGTASFYRLYASDGTTCIAQGTVGTSGAELNLNTTTITSGGPVQITALTISI